MKKLLLIFCLCSVALGTQLAFNGGQLSPKLKYRIDLDRRSTACEELENMMVSPRGRAYKRVGTEMIDDANCTDNVRLIPFEYSTNDAYVLEFTHNSIGFFRTP